MGIYRIFLKNIFDKFISFLSLTFFSPLLIFVYFLILFIDGRPVFFKQSRVGKNFIPFDLIKFRTMKINNSNKKLTSYNDKRITRIGLFLRKYKLDELPQLINVLKGDMSIVGPRPEVNEYTKLYDKKLIKKILSVKPGITDYASIFFLNEEKFFKNINKDKEMIQIYKKKIIPIKQKLYLKYLNKISFSTDLKIIFLTFRKIISL